MGVRTAADHPIWARLDAVVDRASNDDLISHRLEAIAARRYRSTGRAVPATFANEERVSALRVLTSIPLLQRIRAAVDGPIVLFKGPEVARLYPDPAMRPFVDLDLLVEDAAAAQRALLESGFTELGRPAELVDPHHLQPLWSASLPLAIEIHSRPQWLGPTAGPDVGQLFDVSTPSTLGVEGISALPPEHHVLLLAVHSWVHEPLRRLRDIVDVALVHAGADPAEVERLAKSWGISRLWHTTCGAVETVAEGRPPSLALRTWGRSLCTCRERTVLEDHLQRWLADFSIMPPARATARLPRAIASDLLPERGESWRTKGRRSVWALRNARNSRSLHQGELDERGMAGPRRAGPSDPA